MDFTARTSTAAWPGSTCSSTTSTQAKKYRTPPTRTLRLPSHPYDYPLIFQDKRFGADKRLVFDQFTPEGVPGDKVTVNGKIEPVLRVARRKYRLRLLNGGPTRFYEFYLVNAGALRRTPSPT